MGDLISMNLVHGELYKFCTGGPYRYEFIKKYIRYSYTLFFKVENKYLFLCLIISAIQLLFCNNIPGYIITLHPRCLWNNLLVTWHANRAPSGRYCPIGPTFYISSDDSDVTDDSNWHWTYLQLRFRICKASCYIFHVVRDKWFYACSSQSFGISIHRWATLHNAHDTPVTFAVIGIQVESAAKECMN